MWTAAIGIVLVIQRVDFQRMHLEMFNLTEFYVHRITQLR